MVQWINLWYNSFVNRRQLPLLCEKTGAIALALLSLTARLNSAKFRIFKIIYWTKYCIARNIDMEFNSTF